MYIKRLQFTGSQKYFDTFICDIVDNHLRSDQVAEYFYQYLEDIIKTTLRSAAGELGLHFLRISGSMPSAWN